MNKLTNVISVLKGGKGSGNFNHSGRPGKRGGSGLGGGRFGAKIRDELLTIAGDNAQRKKLATLAGHAISELHKKGILKDVVEIRVVGSFASNKESPNDIDLAFLVPEGISGDKIKQLWLKTEIYDSLPKQPDNKSVVDAWFTKETHPLFEWFEQGTRDKYNVDPVSVWSNAKDTNISNE